MPIKYKIIVPVLFHSAVTNHSISAPRRQCWRKPGSQHHPQDHHQPHPQARRPGAELCRAPHPVLSLTIKTPLPHGPSPHVRDPPQMSQCLSRPKLLKNLPKIHKPGVEISKVCQRHLHVATAGRERTSPTFPKDSHHCL